MHFTHYNDDFYIEYVIRVNGPDDKWHDNDNLEVLEYYGIFGIFNQSKYPSPSQPLQ